MAGLSRRLRQAATIVAVGLALACQPDPPELRTATYCHAEPTPVSVEVRRVSLSPRVYFDALAIQPDTGQRFISDGLHLYDLDSMALVWESDIDFGAEDPNYDRDPDPCLSAASLAGMGEGRVVLGTNFEACRVDTSSGDEDEIASYLQPWSDEPRWIPGIDLAIPRLASLSVAYDRASRLVYAGVSENGLDFRLTASHLAAFSEESGHDVVWWRLAPLDCEGSSWCPLGAPDWPLVTYGLEVVDQGQGARSARLLVAAQGLLLLFDARSECLTPLADLAPLGVTDILDIAIDEENGTLAALAVTDPLAGLHEIVEVRLDDLGIPPR